MNTDQAMAFAVILKGAEKFLNLSVFIRLYLWQISFARSYPRSGTHLSKTWPPCLRASVMNLHFSALELIAMEQELRDAVREAAQRAEVVEAVGRIYGELQAEIDRRRPICVVSGRCCRFEEYGHRLYVTTLELAAFVKGLADLSESAGTESRSTDPGGCPFQIKKLCGVHAIRPFGCRVFFCDASATDWQHEQYEEFHARLRALHEELGVPYFYLEWRAALEALELRGFFNTAFD